MVGRSPRCYCSFVLRLGFFQDRDVGVGVFPEREEIFVIKEWLPRGMAES